ncbi:MAG: DUF2804 domain-containing protein [Treponema sp.]|jgi:hypothetical protein|nr:DUF2804 domain-containing protein [Treponema sp.]
MPQIEISAPLSVLDDSGRPVNFGWARSPVFNYTTPLPRTPARRTTASDRYIVFSPTHMLTMQALDNGYLGYVGVSVISLKDKKRSTQYYYIPFPMGSLNLPDSSEKGSVRIRRKNFFLEFTVMGGGIRIIRLDFPKFGHHRYLRGELVLTPLPGAESLVTHMPWPRQKNAFNLTRRSPWFSTEGVIQFGIAEIIFSQGKGWGILDWNRGSRPNSDVRWWASACGYAGDARVGFSVGYGGADSSLGTENAFFLNGRIHKLDQVTFHLTPADWMEPWRFTSNNNRLEMTFHPFQERVERNRMLFHSLNRRQIFGSFSGKVILDDGAPLLFHDLAGVAERRKTIR